MNALLVTVMLVFTPQPELYCEGPQACTWIKQGNMATVFMRDSSPLSRRFDLNPDLVMFPHFASDSFSNWTRCGEEIGRQAGLSVEFNQAVTLCHEAKHALGHKH